MCAVHPGQFSRLRVQMYFLVEPSAAVVLNREGSSPEGGVSKFSWGREPLGVLQHGNFEQ